jgi:PAS domain S-box-containing protein
LLSPESAELQLLLQSARADNARLQAQLEQEQQQRQQAEQRLAFEHLLLQTLVENCPFRIYAKDSASRFIFGNHEVARIMGVTDPVQLLGKADFDFYPEHLARQYYTDEQQLLQSGQPLIAKEEPVIDQTTGQPGWALTSKVHLFDASGKLLGLLGIGFDISERKQLEQQLLQSNRDLTELNQTLSRTTRQLAQAEKLAALGALVAGIAHELNTPIGNSMLVSSAFADQIQAFIPRYRDGLTRETLERFVAQALEASEILLRNLQRASDLITRFKQVAVDQTSTQRRHFLLDEVVAEILLVLSPLLRKAQVTVQENLARALLLDSYPGPLGQILINLIQNALVHGFAGREGGTLAVSAQPHALGERGVQGVQLSVHDDGVGIPAEHLSRIFDPFFTTKMGEGGPGLGLNIAHNIATGLLGGTIEVDSRAGHGTRFVLTLPLLAPGKSATA